MLVLLICHLKEQMMLRNYSFSGKQTEVHGLNTGCKKRSKCINGVLSVVVCMVTEYLFLPKKRSFYYEFEMYKVLYHNRFECSCFYSYIKRHYIDLDKL